MNNEDNGQNKNACFPAGGGTATSRKTGVLILTVIFIIHSSFFLFLSTCMILLCYGKLSIIKVMTTI